MNTLQGPGGVTAKPEQVASADLALAEETTVPATSLQAGSDLVLTASPAEEVVDPSGGKVSQAVFELAPQARQGEPLLKMSETPDAGQDTLQLIPQVPGRSAMSSTRIAASEPDPVVFPGETASPDAAGQASVAKREDSLNVLRSAPGIGADVSPSVKATMPVPGDEAGTDASAQVAARPATGEAVAVGIARSTVEAFITPAEAGTTAQVLPPDVAGAAQPVEQAADLPLAGMTPTAIEPLAGTSAPLSAGSAPAPSASTAPVVDRPNPDQPGLVPVAGAEDGIRRIISTAPVTVGIAPLSQDRPLPGVASPASQPSGASVTPPPETSEAGISRGQTPPDDPGRIISNGVGMPAPEAISKVNPVVAVVTPRAALAPVSGAGIATEAVQGAPTDQAGLAPSGQGRTTVPGQAMQASPASLPTSPVGPIPVASPVRTAPAGSAEQAARVEAAGIVTTRPPTAAQGANVAPPPQIGTPVAIRPGPGSLQAPSLGLSGEEPAPLAATGLIERDGSAAQKSLGSVNMSAAGLIAAGPAPQRSVSIISGDGRPELAITPDADPVSLRAEPAQLGGGAKAATQAPPPPSPTSLSALLGDRVALSRHVSRQLQLPGGTETRTQITLRPDGLGTVEIDLSTDPSGRLSVMLRVENPAVLQALRADRDLLIMNMDRTGVDLDGAQFNFEGFGPGSDSGSDEKPTRRSPYRTEAVSAEAPSRTPISPSRTPLIGGGRIDLFT